MISPKKNYKKTAMLLRCTLLCMAAGVLFFTLRGIGETLTPWSQATVSLLTNLYYPERARNEITVLLFREEDLESLGKKIPGNKQKTRIPFPLPYETHIESLTALANWQPRAVLIDFAFIDTRQGDDIEKLLAAICDLDTHGTKVYLASFYYWQPYHGLRKDLFLDSKGRDRARCFTVVPVNYKPDGSGLAQTYELMQGPDEKSRTPSAALQMYADATQSQVDYSQFSDRMDVLWGSLPPRPQRSDTPCTPVKLTERAIRLAKDGPRALEQDCPYSNTLSVYSLWNESSDDIKALLTNKFVIYGARFIGTDDWLKSPVHGTLPGVYLHAMALDNLLIFGNQYKRLGEHGVGANRYSVLFADFLLILLGVIWHLLVVSFQHKRQDIAKKTTDNTQENNQKNNSDILYFCLFASPYLLLSIVAAGGLWLAGSHATAIFQFVLVGSLAIAGARTFFKNHSNSIPEWANTAISWLRDKLIDHSWLALMAVMCSLIFYCWNLGPRNFWAFAAFLGFTHLIDKRLRLAAQHIDKNKPKKKFSTSWIVIIIGILTAVITPFIAIFKISTLTAISLAGAISFALLLLVWILFKILPWLYQGEID